MATGYFGTVLPYFPSYLTEGEYSGVLASGTQGGSGKSLVVRSSANGIPTKIRLVNLSWVGNSKQSYTARFALNSALEGEGHEMEFTFQNVGGFPVSTTNNIYEDGLTARNPAVVSPGLNYQKNETVTFSDGVVSGEAVIEASAVPVFSVLEVLEEGSDYTDEDVLTIPASEFLRVRPSATHKGPSLGIPFFKSSGNTGESNGEALSLKFKNTGVEVPVLEGVYKGVPVSGGTGAGLVADLTVVGSGGKLSAIGEKSGWGAPLDSTAIVPPRPVLLSGGSGLGASVFVGLRKMVPNSADKLNPDYAYGFYTAGLSTGGAGYQSTDVLSIERDDLINAGFELNPLHAAENISVRGVTVPSISLDVAIAGTGYVNGENAYIDPTALEAAGATVAGSTQRLSVSVRTLNEYGYPGIPSKNYNPFSSVGVHLTMGGRTSQFDAKEGVLDERITWTTGDAGRPLAPESSGAPSIPTKEDKTKVLIRSDGYVESLPGAGPYVQQESLPVPLYVQTSEVAPIVDEYSRYLKRFTIGDFYGTAIQEGVRIEVYQGWTPNMPFRYADPFNDRIVAMRMDATSWSVDTNGAVFSTNGIWIGESNGQLNVSPNIQGIANGPTPGFLDTTGLPYPVPGNVSGTGGSGTSPIVDDPPGIDDETYVDFGDYSEIFDIYLGVTIEMDLDIRPPGQVSVLPVNNVFNNITTAMYLRGEVVTAGDTIDSTDNGGIPASAGDSLLTNGFTAVIEDLFDYD